MKLNCGIEIQIRGCLGRQELAVEGAVWKIMSLDGSQFSWYMCEPTCNTRSEQFAKCFSLTNFGMNLH